MGVCEAQRSRLGIGQAHLQPVRAKTVTWEANAGTATQGRQRRDVNAGTAAQGRHEWSICSGAGTLEFYVLGDWGIRPVAKLLSRHALLKVAQ